jgi:hypothetical protein
MPQVEKQQGSIASPKTSPIHKGISVKVSAPTQCCEGAAQGYPYKNNSWDNHDHKKYTNKLRCYFRFFGQRQIDRHKADAGEQSTQNEGGTGKINSAIFS